MKILHVCDNLYPDRAGGSEIVIYETCRALVRLGHDVTVLTYAVREGLPEFELIEGIKVYRFTVPDSAKAATQIPMSARKAFRKAFTAVSPEIIHFHHTPSAFGVNLSRRPKGVKKLVYTYYGPISQEFEIEQKDRGEKLSLKDSIKSGGYRMAERFNLTRADVIVALSEYSKWQIKTLHGGQFAKKTVVIPAGTDTERFSPANDIERREIRQRLSLPPRGELVLTVRRLVKRMGIDMLIEGYRGVLKDHPDATLVIGGTGPEKESLASLAQSLGIAEKVLFKGYIPSQDLPLYYRAADLFVLPTRDLEGFGLVTLEALASGTPVIGTATGATVEVLGGLDKKLLITDISPDGIMKSINRFLKDGTALAALRAGCREYVLKNYSWDRMAEALAVLYRS